MLRTVEKMILGLILLPVAAVGHHSNVEYDFDVFEELEGRVLSVSWRNPHVLLTLGVSRDDGTQDIWDLEAQDVNSLGRRGLSPELIRAGDTVRVAGNPSGRRERSLYVTNVLLPNGTEIRTRGATAPRWSSDHIGFEEPAVEVARAAAANEARGIFRVWMREISENFPAELPLTAAASSALAAWDPADNLTLKCVAGGMPSVMRLSAPHPIDFIEGEGRIVMRIELFDIERTIFMDANMDDPAGFEQSPTPLGFSVGSWEGNTLVVHTTRVNWPYFNNIGSIPQSDDIDIVERFTLSEDERQLTYDITVTDPNTFTEPVSAHWVLGWRPDMVVEPYRCTLGE